MTARQTNRKLAAIVAADVVGYSRMMARDEVATLDALKRHREHVLQPAIARCGGRIVKLMGDGVLVEFGSVVDAVECALAVQRARAGTEGTPSNEQLLLRIGINLGDVIIDDDDIYGDGVNVAARLEPLAEPGGLCVSSIVAESVGNRIDVVFRDAGVVHVKNIDRPIRIWKWTPEDRASEVAHEKSSAGMSEDARDAPSIAVLPFANMSGDAEQEYFADGIAEDIITDLSKVGSLLVIARNSTFVYKGRNVDIRAVARDLGVRSVLEGSIRRAGNRVRITAQLIDAATGGHLWADRYDRDITDIFEVQDEVTRQIVDALRVTLTPAEDARLSGGGTRNLQAHECYLKAREFLFGANKNRETFHEARELLEQAVGIDPAYAEALAGLGFAHIFDYFNRWSSDADRALQRTRDFADKAIAADPNEPFGHLVAARASMFFGDLTLAEAQVKAALSISPNYAMGHYTLGCIRIYVGEPLAAIPQIERAMRLDPAYSQQYLHFLGTAYLVAAKYETAAALFKQRTILVPETDLSRAFLASALGHLGEIDEARRVWSELRTINADYSFADHLARLPFKVAADIETIKEGLRKAGLAD